MPHKLTQGIFLYFPLSGKDNISIMEENYLYAMNKCFLLLLVLSYGKDKAFAIQGKPQFEQTNGPFQSVYQSHSDCEIASR